MNLNSTNVSILKRLLVGRNSRPLRTILQKLPPVDLASLLSSFNDQEARSLIDALVELDKAADTLVMLPEARLPHTLSRVSDRQIVAILRDAPDDQSSLLLGACPPKRREQLLHHFDDSQQNKFNQLLNYPENSAGRLMRTQFFTLPDNISTGEGLRQLRSQAQKESIFYIYVVDTERRLKGVASLRAIAMAPEDTPIHSLIQTEIHCVQPNSPQEEAAELVSHYDFVALPVVDSEQKLLGIITVDDVLDIIEDRATADIYAQAGLQGGDRVYSPALLSIKSRIPWMLLNLVLAAMTSVVVSLFEETMSQLIVLASLNNIVAGIGGNTAIQTLTVITRGLATGDFDFTSYGKAILKESLVGLTVGLFVGLAAGLLVWIWKDSAMVGAVIAISMILNSLVAAAFGAIIPLALKATGRDPAIGSGVLVTTISDMFGFFSFLGIATLGLTFFV